MALALGRYETEDERRERERKKFRLTADMTIQRAQEAQAQKQAVVQQQQNRVNANVFRERAMGIMQGAKNVQSFRARVLPQMQAAQEEQARRRVTIENDLTSFRARVLPQLEQGREALRLYSYGGPSYSYVQSRRPPTLDAMAEYRRRWETASPEERQLQLKLYGEKGVRERMGQVGFLEQATTSLIPEDVQEHFGEIPFTGVEVPLVGEAARRTVAPATSPLGLATAAVAPEAAFFGLGASFGGSMVGDIAEQLGAPDKIAGPIGTRSALEIGTGLYGGPLKGRVPKVDVSEAGTAAARRFGYESPGAMFASEQGSVRIPFGRRAAEEVTEQAADTRTFAGRTPSEATDALFGAHPVKGGLTSTDKIYNRLARIIGKEQWSEDALVTQINRSEKQLNLVGESLSNRISAEAGSLIKRHFKFDKAGRIVDLPGNPTLADLAAYEPRYWSQLSPGQQGTLRFLREELGRYGAAMREQGIEFGMRADVQDGGGFWIPRDVAELEGEATKVKFRGGRRGGGGKISAEHAAKFLSQSEGIEAGYTYVAPAQAIHDFTNAAARRIARARSNNLLKDIINESGERVGTTSAMRLDARYPGLRERVQKLRASVRARALTLRNQIVRSGAQGVEAERAGRVAAAASERTERARARYIVRQEEYHPGVLRTAQEDAGRAFEEARTINRDFGENRVRMAQGKKALSAEEKALQSQVDELNQLVAESERIVNAASGTKYADYVKVERQIQRVDSRIARIASRVDEMSSRVDDMAARGELLRDMDANTRASWVGARQAERSERQAESMLAAARAELRALEAQEARAARSANRASARANKAATRAEDTGEQLGAMRQELADIEDLWATAKATAAETPRNQASITDIPNYSFPTEMANARNKFIESTMPASGYGAVTTRLLSAANTVMRALAASFDISFTGTQGILALIRDPARYGKAWTLAARSLFDPHAFGKAVRQFDEAATAAGRPTSREWVQRNGRMGGTGHEFSFEHSGLEGVPGFKQASRAFGVFGDHIRLLLQDAKWRPGMTDAEMDDIARNAGNMTGWSTKTGGSSLVNLLLFAPRFYASQAELLARAALGGNSRAAWEARRSLGQLIAVGVAVTVGANEALNNNYDYWSPTIDGKPNPNFMRIRVGGMDVSVFGPWDSVFKAALYVGTGHPEDALRTRASPLLQIVLDSLYGETFMGDTVDIPSLAPWQFDENTLPTLKNLGRQRLPFSTQNISLDDPLAAPLSALGIKASPVTDREWRDQQALRKFGVPFEQLTADQIATLDQGSLGGVERLIANMPRWDGVTKEREFEMYDFRDRVTIEWNKLKQELGEDWPGTQSQVAVLLGEQEGDPELGRLTAAWISDDLPPSLDRAQLIIDNQDSLPAEMLATLPQWAARQFLTEENLQRMLEAEVQQ